MCTTVLALVLNGFLGNCKLLIIVCVITVNRHGDNMCIHVKITGENLG